MSPTSPRDTIPTPTRMPLALLLRKSIAGSPHPNSFVTMATAIKTPLSISMVASTALKSTCAPMIEKKSGANIRAIFCVYVPTTLKIFVVDRAIPTAKAPTIGDSPMVPANAAAPKNDAVAIPSTLPWAFHRRVDMRRGITTTAAISMAAKTPSTCSMVMVTSVMSMLSRPSALPAMDVTTDSTAIASMSSTMAAPIIRRASGVFSLPSS